MMKREMGDARCGLACCLCSENDHCHGCDSGECPDASWCENRKCSLEKAVSHCHVCPEARRYGVQALLDCLERNEQNGVVYHREGVVGDYDDFTDVEELIRFIQTGRR